MILTSSLGGGSFFMTQAQMIQALVVMFQPDFNPTAWQLYLVCHRLDSMEVHLLAQ